ncbi:MAG: DNA-binding protein [Thermomicrobiales bacterium]
MDVTGHPDKSMEELFESESLTPEELATLLEIPLHVIRSAAYAGDLTATIVNHDIISIKRDDALAWIAKR